ncbi:MAG: hypothetical protein AAB449_00545 [Patescibacteria group bacterium]
MADEEKSKANPAGIALALIGFLAAVTIGWFMFGGPSRADLSGYFLSPPTAPQVIIPADGSGIIQGSTTTPPSNPEGLTP